MRTEGIGDFIQLVSETDNAVSGTAFWSWQGLELRASKWIIELEDGGGIREC